MPTSTASAAPPAVLLEDRPVDDSGRGRRRRARDIAVWLIAVLVTAYAAAIVAANPAMRWDSIGKFLTAPIILQGLGVTILLTVASAIIGFAGGLVIALMRMSANPLIRTIAIGYLGFYAPNIFVSNQVSKRQKSIRRAWPDALDLMLICVESGISIEVAFKRVADEIAMASPELAEELVLTTAELSFLQERRVAYDNLGTRIGLDTVKSVTQALIQAERYGTPLAQALRVLAQECRDQRMNEAEKKAAALPPKLTVPMILFFLPVLVAVILGPAGIQVSDRF